MPDKDGYTDQSPDALRLALCDGDVDRSGFLVLDARRMETDWLRVDAVIIGASHLITYTTAAGEVFTEVFSCADLPLGDSWPLDKLECEPVSRELNGFCYRFSVQRVPWVDPEPLELQELISRVSRLESRRDGLGAVHEFPRGRLSAPPKTVVIAERDYLVPRVVITTAHAYPNVGKLVLSTSIVTRTGGATK